MGTPEFAVASLKRLVEDGHEICGVFTQPDRPKNRGHKLAFSPVKEYALSQGLTVYQPTKMRDGTALALVRELHPELIVVAAYGRILPEDILNTPPYGSINVHSSLLPKYRGAAPINWAILNGERETGVTIMYMAKELDAGDILHVLKTDIDPQEDAQALTARLAELGAQALSETVEQLRAGTAHRTVQDHSAYTYAPMLTKDMGMIDWTKPAQRIHDQVRGLIPWALCVHGAGWGYGEDIPHGGRQRDCQGFRHRGVCREGGHRRGLRRRAAAAYSGASAPGRPPGWRRRTICGAIPCRWRHDAPGEVRRPGCSPGRADAGG